MKDEEEERKNEVEPSGFPEFWRQTESDVVILNQ